MQSTTRDFVGGLFVLAGLAALCFGVGQIAVLYGTSVLVSYM